LQAADLIRDPLWRAPVVIIEMNNDFTVSDGAAKVALLANAEAFIDGDEADGRISRDKVTNVLAVREYQEFAIRIRLRLKRQDRLREPLASVPCQAQRGDERGDPRSLREPPVARSSFHIGSLVSLPAGCRVFVKVASLRRGPRFQTVHRDRMFRRRA
jgi:hypothetical protein